jgi:hypothetical protein
MAAKLTNLTHKIAIQLHLVAESCTICSSRSRRPVRKLLDTPSYLEVKRYILFYVNKLQFKKVRYKIVKDGDETGRKERRKERVHNARSTEEVM